MTETTVDAHARIGGRMSPYGAVDEYRTAFRSAASIPGAAVGPGPRFAARRGRRAV